MHNMIFVIGDNPLELLADVTPPSGVDWWGIGGRYSGMLILKPGAEGKRYGDTMPAFEAHVAALIPEGVDMSRPGARGDREGVDQARAGDVDWDATFRLGCHPAGIVASGIWHDLAANLTDDEWAALAAAGIPGWKPARRWRKAHDRAVVKMERWGSGIFAPAMAEAEDDNDLVTVVDVHQ